MTAFDFVIPWIFIAAGFGLGYELSHILPISPTISALIGALLGYSVMVCIVAYLKFKLDKD